jgi:4-hydroxythreonine-4-phosphate dehydrogenase
VSPAPLINALPTRLLAVSLGDPAGVGPELLTAAWVSRVPRRVPGFFAIGGAELLREAARRRGLVLPIQPISHPDEAAACFDTALPVLGTLDMIYTPGVPCRRGAELALASLTEAARLAVSGEASGMVTGPIAKSLLAEVGFAHPGQTEFVAQACGVAAQDAVMMLAGPSLRTVPITVHIPLSKVSSTISIELILRRTRIAAAALTRDFGVASPRIAVAALNPHASEAGRMGDEEASIIIPAIAQLRSEGIDATGPHAADALFAPRARTGYDMALCMYHDQALIPLKTLDFDSGVNVTLGLPIIRTSPDHGTAFAIAGKGLADSGATISALRMAGECAARRAAA